MHEQRVGNTCMRAQSGGLARSTAWRILCGADALVQPHRQPHRQQHRQLPCR